MAVIQYPDIQEQVVGVQLSNGLDVHLLRKTGFHKTFAILTTDFGSVDNQFIPRGAHEAIRVPDGIAHFLEHKLFEKKDFDAFELFGQTGASANAFTSFTRTSYLFSTTSQVHENLDILLDFVQSPYFTAASVNKEKGIIGQEIQMYDDDPGWQSYFGTIQNLYPSDPLAIDIAGTVDSIAQITAEALYTTYQTFYHPSNMNLFVVGNIDPDETLGWIAQNQQGKVFAPPSPIQRRPAPLSRRENVVAATEQHLDIVRPRVSVGIRGFDLVPTGRAGLRYNTALTLAFDLLFNDTADNYLRLYDDDIIDDSFGYGFELQRGAHFAQISTDTDRVADFVQAMTDVLQGAHDALLMTEDQFELVKREAIGRIISAMNSVEAIANAYDGTLFDGANLFDELAILQTLTFEDMLQAADAFFKDGAMTTHTLWPNRQP